MKKVEQLLNDGSLTLDYDQPMSVKEQEELFTSLFGNDIKVNKDIRKQFVFKNKIAFLVKSVTYLGNPWPEYKKRIQLSEDFKEQYIKNNCNNLQTYFLGIYRYNDLKLYVVYEPSEYYGKKTHNSSAHVQSFDLQYALKNGFREKTDSAGNLIRVMDQNAFVKFVNKSYEGCADSYHDILKSIFDYIRAFSEQMPLVWNGVDCYEKMAKEKAPNYRQNKWTGWFFEYLFKKWINDNPSKDVEIWGKKKDGDIDLDLKFPQLNNGFGDLKADSINEDIMGNSFESFESVINSGGTVYYVVCLCKTENDKNHGYVVTDYWNEHIREDKKRENDIFRLHNRSGRIMKYSAEPKELKILSIDKTAYDILKQNPMYQGVNSNGKPRDAKLKIKKSLIDTLSIYNISF